MTRTTCLIVLTTILTSLAAATPASAWEFEEFMNPQGDRGIGITQVATNMPGIRLAFGCEGDRWRQVALIPGPPKPLRLASDGKVAIGFKPGQLTPDGKWKVRDAGVARAYFAPAPTPFMGRLYGAEEKDSSSILYVKVRPAKKSPIVLEFPLTGLRKALADHLWKDCKLDIYYGEPDTD